MTETSHSSNLDKVDHIVVLMMENRSFDLHICLSEVSRLSYLTD